MTLPILMLFIWISVSTGEKTIAPVNAVSTVSNTVGNSHRSLRIHRRNTEDQNFFSQKQHKRSLQAYTNETFDYEDGPAVNQDREVDFEYCYGALQRADANNDGRLETADYISFVQDFGSNTECLGDLMSMPTMPIELTACWNQLSCECRNRGGAVDCCEKENAHLPLSGVNAVAPAPSGQTTPQTPQQPYIQQEQNFLKQACLRTDQCVISFCGYPPPPLPILPPIPPTLPPILPTIPPTIPTVPVDKKSEVGLNYWWFLFLLLLLCCCRRRWILCPAGKDDDDEEDDPEHAPVNSSSMNSLPGDNDDNDVENNPDDFDGDYNDPDANRMAMKSTAANEVGEGGGVRYYRVVQEPEYEEPPPPPEPKVIDQYNKGTPEGDAMQLQHIEKAPLPPPEDDPYALEHYNPDGGIMEHERTGEWGYTAEGGYTPEERPTKEASEWNRPGYERDAVVAAVATDDRRDRNLEKYDGGAIFDHLDETDEPPAKGPAANTLEWVFSNTLNTLDDNVDDLRSESSTPSTTQR
eukprot:CAMPEP_0168180148 /NCGR_PEP_ID=MMETSP0139_2-20121125/10324_1 /TAXON_ID=44445 /ORGANISM="Pseudo-nitzschia australis, Strain 10249 10 AB" /LENGTH=523 /DNA_ID=CAMNT_0008100229 /DNA_START=230 /DNA_END=1801 /DNA_ORIENTATION=-